MNTQPVQDAVFLHTGNILEIDYQFWSQGSEGSEDEQPPSKKAKQNPASTTLEEEEELALKMLRSRR